MKARPAKFHSFLHSAHLLEKRLVTLLDPFGIRLHQARVLEALDRIGATSQKVLTEEFAITAGSMSTMIDRLLALGLITRKKDPADLRTDIIDLTDAGRATLHDVRGVWMDIDAMMEDALGPDKMASLIALTKELRSALGGKVPGQGLRRPALQTEDERSPHRDDGKT